jgi:hypothetical protein
MLQYFTYRLANPRLGGNRHGRPLEFQTHTLWNSACGISHSLEDVPAAKSVSGSSRARRPFEPVSANALSDALAGPIGNQIAANYFTTMGAASIFWAVPLALSVIAAVAGLYLAVEDQRDVHKEETRPVVPPGGAPTTSEGLSSGTKARSQQPSPRWPFSLKR